NHRDLISADKNLFNMGHWLKGVAVSNKEISLLAGLDTSQPIIHAKNLGRIYRNCFECLLLAQSVSGGISGMIRSIPDILHVAGSNRYFNARLMQHTRIL